VADAAEVLLWAVRGNYDHPSGVYCQGCSMTFDGPAIIEDLREKGWQLTRLPDARPETPEERHHRELHDGTLNEMPPETRHA
jgi:hypothetical protein